MNHASIVAHESERPYRNRAALFSVLDEGHFDALNQGDHLLCLWGYSLDALDELPAGCMQQWARYPAQQYVTRGVSLAEQRELDDMARKLVAEILAAEKFTPH